MDAGSEVQMADNDGLKKSATCFFIIKSYLSINCLIAGRDCSWSLGFVTGLVCLLLE